MTKEAADGDQVEVNASVIVNRDVAAAASDASNCRNGELSTGTIALSSSAAPRTITTTTTVAAVAAAKDVTPRRAINTYNNEEEVEEVVVGGEEKPSEGAKLITTTIHNNAKDNHITIRANGQANDLHNSNTNGGSNVTPLLPPTGTAAARPPASPAGQKEAAAASGAGALAGRKLLFKKPQQKQKSEENEIQVLERVDHQAATDNAEHKQQQNGVSWMVCAPCIWMRRSTTLHKFALTTATLLVTSILVISPILFLISTAPSQSAPKDCLSHKLEDCYPTPVPAPECSTEDCRIAALTIYSRINDKFDPCKGFRQYSCSSDAAPTLLKYNNRTTLGVRSAQEAVDLEMLQLLTETASKGFYRKLGRLYDSCMQQRLQSATVKRLLENLGGYLPDNTVGPSSLSPLISKISAYGPNPLIGIYYDLSYGRKPKVMLIIDEPTISAPVLENSIRWMGPKTPPYKVKQAVPELLEELLDVFLPSGLTSDTKLLERNLISNFLMELNLLRQTYMERDFSNSYVVYNASSLAFSYPFLNWSAMLVPREWQGPIIVRSVGYFSQLPQLLDRHSNRVIHNSLILLFVLSALPQSRPSPLSCTKKVMWAMPQASSALYLSQYSMNSTEPLIKRTEILFETLKAHLKRAPSLKGAALVKLSSLKIQANPSPTWYNSVEIEEILNRIEVSSDDWLDNVLKLYKLQQIHPKTNLSMDVHIAWAYPTIAQSFYDTLSHSIVVPLSVILVPYFKSRLPQYLYYSSVGVQIAKEILRSITKGFDEKALKCVPGAVNVFSNHSRMDILIHSGGMQIAYHSLMSLSGPLKGMERLSGLNMTPMQIFYLVSAQELCADSKYGGIDTDSENFGDILTWLIAQGGKAKEVFQCPHGSHINVQKTCNIL